MSNDRLKYLLERYASDSSTPEETKELINWIKELKDDELLKQKVHELWTGYDFGEPAPEADWNKIYTKIVNSPAITQVMPFRLMAAAAAAIVLFMAAGYFIFNKKHVQPVAVTGASEKEVKSDLAPGRSRAVLTLANGDKIILDSVGNGTVTQQGDIRVIKLDDGRLSYNTFKGKSEDVIYNTISTPHGGQYEIVLADGSKVWLNAASSLRFPVSFRGEKRDVELVGEGYFEVAHNAEKPFLVSVNGMEIKVLGTHFNVNAYADDGAIKTTLLEGSVKVSKGTAERMISPGEQAAILNSDNAAHPEITVQPVDVNAVTAWKNGRFVFKGDNIQSVMRQLARWYDADINYEGDVTSEQFFGVINRSRYDNIVDILEMMEKTGTMSYAIKGRQITVMPFKK